MDGKQTPWGTASVCKADVRALRSKRPMDRDYLKRLGPPRPIVTLRGKIHMKNDGIIEANKYVRKCDSSHTRVLVGAQRRGPKSGVVMPRVKGRNLEHGGRR